MPKTPIDYSKACIYQICCKDLSIKDVYVGSTTNLIERRRTHKVCCHNERTNYHNIPVYRFIRDHGGFDNWTVIKVEDAPVTCREDLLKLERACMVRLKATLNGNVPGRSVKEYRETYKEKMKEQQIEYRELNKEKIKEQQKEYYDANKDKILEKKAVKVTCGCGSIVGKHHMARHCRTKKHQKYLETI
jgi:ribosomal protein S27AE